MATAKKVIPIAPLKRTTSWSFSRYSDYKTCAHMFYHKHIAKTAKEPPSEAMSKGTNAHDDAEAYVKGTLAKLPYVLMPMKKEFDRLRKMYKQKKLPMIVEDNWAFTEKWDETEWNNWAECWVRIKLDVAHYDTPKELVITDWKTGKESEWKNAEYMEQLELYAVAALLMSAHDDVIVKPRLGWVESGTFYVGPNGEQVSYTKKDLPRLKKTWEVNVKPMMNDTRYAPKANSKCKWCFFGQDGKARGGPGVCKF